jgi:hypothetical protein
MLRQPPVTLHTDDSVTRDLCIFLNLQLIADFRSHMQGTTEHLFLCQAGPWLGCLRALTPDHAHRCTSGPFLHHNIATEVKHHVMITHAGMTLGLISDRGRSTIMHFSVSVTYSTIALGMISKVGALPTFGRDRVVFFREAAAGGQGRVGRIGPRIEVMRVCMCVGGCGWVGGRGDGLMAISARQHAEECTCTRGWTGTRPNGEAKSGRAAPNTEAQYVW